ncbi:Cyclin-dependent kinase inhibitor 3 [Platanthera zijinensis]|uniref:Cyclin-dependent kinase inhibitor 3 n=1 Tax=Platanthera zijinensis TaxID=2320716 RepID=A0AAP0BY63_9ASPA
MGKHISKTKLAGEVALMEVSIQSSIGVRTRARTLALQRLQKPSTFPDADTSSFSSSEHLLLRGRRLEKPAITLKAMHQAIPSSHEIEEFFSGAERLQQRTFMEKYNYDPVNDSPLSGRYEWVKLHSN